MAFKGIPETDDLRGSMSIAVLNTYKNTRKNDNVIVYDPVISTETLLSTFKDIRVAPDIASAITGAHVVIIANNHPSLSRMEPQTILDKMETGGFIYDY